MQRYSFSVRDGGSPPPDLTIILLDAASAKKTDHVRRSGQGYRRPSDKQLRMAGKRIR